MSEHQSQAAFFAWAARQKIPGIELLHACPNGGSRHMLEAVNLKKSVVKAGVPDVSWPVARGGFIGLAIEFKHSDGNPSAEQRRRITQMQEEGWCVAVCWSWPAAARLLTGYAGMMWVSFDKYEMP